MKEILGSCAQCGAVVATSPNYGRRGTKVTRPANMFRDAIEVYLCECCDNPRDPRNTIAQEASIA